VSRENIVNFFSCRVLRGSTVNQHADRCAGRSEVPANGFRLADELGPGCPAREQVDNAKRAASWLPPSPCLGVHAADQTEDDCPIKARLLAQRPGQMPQGTFTRPGCPQEAPEASIGRGFFPPGSWVNQANNSNLAHWLLLNHVRPPVSALRPNTRPHHERPPTMPGFRSWKARGACLRGVWHRSASTPSIGWFRTSW
jgi:hypothetical protein